MVKKNKHKSIGDDVITERVTLIGCPSAAVRRWPLPLPVAPPLTVAHLCLLSAWLPATGRFPPGYGENSHTLKANTGDGNLQPADP